MNALSFKPAPRQLAMAALLAAAVLPGWSHAAEDPAVEENERRTEQVRRDNERQAELMRQQSEDLQRRQADAVARTAAEREAQQYRRQVEQAGRRNIELRERTQQQALRSQEQSIDRLEQRLQEAQRRLDDSSQEVAQLSNQLGRNFAFNFSTMGAPPPRALLGISVDTTGQRRDGALVQQVSPGGAAAEAGVKVGDVITALGGQDLTTDANPARALVEKMRQVEPDQALRVELLREGKKMALNATPRPAGSDALASGRIAEMQERLGQLRERFNDNHPQVRELSGQLGDLAFGGMEFATLSEGLGSYFGVKSGVLVVRAGANAPFGLKDGDVVLAIDGRTPSNAQHAGRILRSYQPGEKLKLRVQRDRKAIDLDATAPGARPN